MGFRDTDDCNICGHEHQTENCFYYEQKKFTCRWCQQHHTHLERECLQKFIEKKEQELENLRAYQLLPQVLPCPCCANDNILITEPSPGFVGPQCQRCGLRTANTDRSKAVQAWNTRNGKLELLNDPELSTKHA